MTKSEKLKFDQLEETVKKQARTIERLQSLEPILEELQQTNRILGNLVTIFHTWYQMRGMGYNGPA
jgi:hypothetical protein